MSEAYSVDPFEPFEVDGFLITGPLYFIGPSPPPPELVEACRRLLRLTIDVDGKEVRFIPAFTDLDTAERFLDLRPDRGAGLNAIRPHTRRQLAESLAILAMQGDYALGVDPDGKALPRLLPLFRFLEVLASELR